MCPTSLKNKTIQAPKLDGRDARELVVQCEALAKQLTPDWTANWPTNKSESDPGITLFRLFALLGTYQIEQLNSVANQRMLAFLRYFGIVPRPPWSAKALLTFTHTPGTSSINLPEGTRVAYVPSEEATIKAETAEQEQAVQSNQPEHPERQILFQTTTPLMVVPAVLRAAYTLNPAQDRYLDQSPPAEQEPSAEKHYRLFGNQPTRMMDHLFLMADPLFAPSNAPDGFSLIITGENLIAAWFQLWFDGNGTPLPVDITARPDGSRLEVKFAPLPEDREPGTWQEAVDAVLGIEREEEPVEQEETETPDYWLVTRPMQGLPVLPRQGPLLPEITTLNTEVSTAVNFPEATYFNDIELDIKNGALPFGETPVEEDCFYIGSEQALGKPGAQVRIDFSLKTIVTPPGQEVTAILAWEYWNGTFWQGFSDNPEQNSFVNRSNNFYGDNLEGGTFISFNSPVIPLTTVGEQENHWIRARIVSGDYGREFDFEPLSPAQIIDQIPGAIMSWPARQELIKSLAKIPGFTFGYVINDSRYYPPFVQALHMSYQEQAELAQTVAYNNYEARNLFREPYEPLPGMAQAFLMGFEVAGFERYTVGKTLTLFFQLRRERAVGDSPKLDEIQSEKVIWTYYDGKTWQTMPVKDQTGGLIQNEIVSLELPADMRPGELFGSLLYWIRVENNDLYRKRGIRITGIWPNTVPAENYETIRNEILGSGQGEPNQRVALSQPFILERQQVAVIEPTAPTREAIEQAEADGQSLDPKTADQNSPQTQVHWTEVENFALSNSLSRHYTINRTTGEITFGNSVQGMTAPVGEDNIIATQYRSCRGLTGNVPANTITAQQESYPQVTTVTNHIPATMGRDGDTDSQVAQVGPWQMRNREQAVTSKDYEQLAIIADTAVSKASACSRPNGDIKVYIYAHTDTAAGKEPRPLPVVLESVAIYLRERMLTTLVDRLLVLPPDFLRIDLFISYSSDHSQARVQRAIHARLEEYFNLMTGGPCREGWDFGGDVDARDISDELTTSVADATDYKVTANGQELVQLTTNQLPILNEVTYKADRGGTAHAP